MKLWKALLLGTAAIIIVAIVLLLGWMSEWDINYQRFFADNEQVLTLYADQFLDQANILDISRHRIYDGIYYGIDAKNHMKGDLGPYMSFTVPYNEERFWEQADITKIKGFRASAEKTFGQFLQDNDISKEEFEKWRAFLAKYNLVYVSRDHEAELIDIGATSNTGFLYRRHTDVSFGYGPKYIEVLNENWAYYDEHGVHNSASH